MSRAEHAQGPYRAIHRTDQDGAALRSVVVWRGALICEVVGAPSHADRIALCLNSHDELLAALALAISLLRTHVDAELLGGERFDQTDCTDVAPIFAALHRAGAIAHPRLIP